MIAVTGAAGFIGSCFVKKLNDEGHKDVLVIDTLEQDERWKNLVGKQFITIEHPEEFRRKCIDTYSSSDVSAIVHMGACSSTTEKNADYLLDNNYRYSIALAEFAEKHSIPFLYASSAATYGAGEQGYDDGLGAGLRPLNMYGYSKQLFDEWMIRTGLIESAIGIKFFNVFGPNEYHKAGMASMIFKAWKQIRENGSISLFKSNTEEYADGGQMRDFIYVKDACEVMWKMLNSQSPKGLVNLGTGKARSWNDLAHAVFSSLNMTAHINYVDMPESLQGQYQNYTQAEMSKLQHSAASHTFMELEESVADYVTAYLEKSISYY